MSAFLAFSWNCLQIQQNCCCSQICKFNRKFERKQKINALENTRQIVRQGWNGYADYQTDLRLRNIMNLMMVSIVNIFQAHSIVVNIFSITHILRVNINFGSVGLFFCLYILLVILWRCCCCFLLPEMTYDERVEKWKWDPFFVPNRKLNSRSRHCTPYVYVLRLFEALNRHPTTTFQFLDFLFFSVHSFFAFRIWRLTLDNFITIVYIHTTRHTSIYLYSRKIHLCFDEARGSCTAMT